MTRTQVMGILNVTPDSFSDGGLWVSPDVAVRRGLDLAADGADIVDVGGESTRPGAERVDEVTELARVLPVVAALASEGVTVSIDTTRALVAAEAVAAGASWVNDVSGGLADEVMLDTVAGLDAGYVAMHWRGHADEMADRADYDDVVAEVAAELSVRRDAALAAGIAAERLVLDPGLGFAKRAEHNWALLAGWDALTALGHPLLLGASRKRFLGTLLGERPAVERDAATAALTAIFATRGVWGVRVHDARSSADAVAVATRLGGV